MRNIYRVLYYLIGIHLPSSYFPMGKVFAMIRIHWMRHFMHIGKGCQIQSNVYVGNGAHVTIGSNCQISENVRIRNANIGNYVTIATGVNILGPNHITNDLDTPMALQGGCPTKQTIIEDDVWLCTNCIIMNGVRISHGCIIAAGAVVTKDCIPFGIYAGVPAKLIKTRG